MSAVRQEFITREVGKRLSEKQKQPSERNEIGTSADAPAKGSVLRVSSRNLDHVSITGYSQDSQRRLPERLPLALSNRVSCEL